MAVLNRESFLKRVVVEPVELSNGDTVYIRALPASMIVGVDQDALGENLKAGNMLVHSLCDADGKRLFADDEGTAALTVDLASLKVLTDAINTLNGFTASRSDTQEQAEKN